MEPLRTALQKHGLMRRKLFQVEFMASTLGEILVTLAYHRPLDDEWEAEARILAEILGISIVGRSRKQKRILGRDYVVDQFRVGERDYRYRQYEQSFVQPNAPINREMLNWAVGQCDQARGDLLELYCGNGNFTLPLSRCFRRVLATELSKSGTRAALENCADNGIDNISVVRLSSEEVSQAMAGVRAFRRLAGLPLALEDHDLHTVFVDPPRAGLDSPTRDCVRRFPRILYISCNPDTLRRDIEELGESHRIGALAFFDQFPYTPHLESGVVLDRRA